MSSPASPPTQYSTSRIVYPCCEVADTITFKIDTRRGYLPDYEATPCWNCGEMTGQSFYDLPVGSNMHLGFKTTSATYTIQKPTEEFFLWLHP